MREIHKNEHIKSGGITMKIRLAVIFGGESVEHEISIISALQAIEQFDQEKYEIVPIYISKDNKWYTGDILFDIEQFKDLDFVVKNATQVKLIANDAQYFLYEYPFKLLKNKPVAEFDVAFPIVHGTNVEDGTVQGLLDAYRIPYAGPDIRGAATGQDKVLMKLVWQASQLPVVPYIWFYAKQWESMRDAYVKNLEEQIGYPMIIKPASLGSSVGISLAKDKESLIEGINEAIQYDDKILVEQALTDFTEVNCSVLGHAENAKASVIEKVFSQDELLSYQDKYQGGSSNSSKGKLGSSKMPQALPMKGKMTGAKTTETSGGMVNTSREIPAKLEEKVTETIQKLSEVAFKTLGMSGVSRIDFLIDDKTGKVYLNEINTIPGSLSFYLWEASGKPYKELLDDMVSIAVERFRKKEKQTFTYDSNVLAMQGQASNGKAGTKGAKGTTGSKTM